MVEEVKNDIGIMDDTGEDIKESLLATHRKELVDAEKNVKDTEKLLERFKTQVERIERIWEIRLQGFRKIVPIMEYEKSDEFWELQVEEEKMGIEDKRAQYDGQMKMLEAQIENNKIRIEELTEKIAKLEAE